MKNEFPGSEEIKPDERIGLLLVHGVGEQRQFQHLAEVCHHIKYVLNTDDIIGKLQTEVLVKTKSDGAYGAKNQTWSADKAPITLRVLDRLERIIDIEFHEVWWADLGEPTTFKTVFHFWLWGTSLWSRRRYIENLRVDNAGRMRLPSATPSTDGSSQPPKLGFFGRLKLFGLSWIALIVMPVIGFINRTLSVFNLQIARLDTISQYLSRTKIFSQQQRKSHGPITDADHPPRIGIRRRMVQATVKMALLDYDRWYILAHSQGTILAFNTLMETEQNLPNYLDQELWRQAGEKLYKKAQNEKQQAQGRMRPYRPNWLKPEDLLNRKELFKKLRGFMSYGSPLSKFAKLWPAIVQLNKDECVFQNDFEWINIYDPTDPIADSVEQFFKPSQSNTDTTSLNIAPAPKDYAYKAKFWHLLSHINYLTPETKRQDRLINELVEWILTEKRFNEEGKLKNNHSKRELLIYDIIRILLWWITGFICIGILSFTVKHFPFIKSYLVQRFVSYMTNSLSTLVPFIPIGLVKYIISGMLFSIGGALIILVLGILGFIQENLLIKNINDIQTNIFELLREKPNKKYTLDEIKNELHIYKNQPKQILKALENLTKNKNIKKMGDDKYVFPAVKFILSPDIINDQNCRHILNTKRKVICDALSNQLNYAPDNEHTFSPTESKTIIVTRYQEENWLMAINYSQEIIFLYYNLDKYYQNDEIVITRIDILS